MSTLPYQRPQISVLTLAVSLLMLPPAFGHSLEEAVAHTLDTHPEIRIAFNRFKVREEQVNQAYSGYMPTVDITAGYGWEQTDSPSTRRKAGLGDVSQGGTMELYRGEASVSLKQMLFDGFYTSSEVNRYSSEASAEQWALYGAAEDMALDVTKVYVNYIRAKQILILSERNLQSHKDIYSQIKQRTDSGLGSIADLSQISGRLARANANVISAKNNINDARAQYLSVTELEPDNLTLPVPDTQMMPIDLNNSIAIATQDHPVLKSAANDIIAAKSERDSTFSNYYPQISLEISSQWNNDTQGEDGYSAISSQNVNGYNNNLVGMVRMRYNLFSGGKDLHREKEAAYKINEAKEIRQRANRQVIEGVRLAWNAFEMLEPQKQFIRDHVIAAKRTQVAYAQQFNLGQRTLLDLLDTENELFEARKDYLQTEYDEIIAYYRVFNATGQLLDSLRVTRPEVWRGENDDEGGVK
ncbi:TolC family outer membrane protein [Shewanella intestini]|uniref:TolC family outer membrane protein n=1 Tax=Shewanella intestini TaxID=2017544 RepID=A0ABS5I2E4_9GAMM|nr:MULTISPECIES: TolC family outer membrane protein [Shewanella]MBR9728194.1 TolC family outer membrane protein [Shewanella intestini]MRG36666.1 TolC family outer membrane protein [Shewanella sp. XMDDZSB0408]